VRSPTGSRRRKTKRKIESRPASINREPLRGYRVQSPGEGQVTCRAFRALREVFSMEPREKYFLPFQRAWLKDSSALRIMQKSRQVGASFTHAYDSVKKAACVNDAMDIWVSSRDETQARLYIEDCTKWAKLLQSRSHPQIVYTNVSELRAYVLQFASGRRIYCVSSNPNALAGKRGHVKLDEFALHQDQRMLYRVAKPVTQWGGTLSIISTHRGSQSVFSELIRDITERGNPMGWSLHTVPVQKAVEQGLVEKINAKAGSAETREEFIARLRAQCIDEEQWLQEYCCTAADESTAFITFEMVTGCEEEGLRLMTVEELEVLPGRGNDGTTDEAARRDARPTALYLGLDVARKHDLCVFDVGEKIGDVVWDRLRIEMRGCRFAEIEETLFRLLRLPQLKRACIDATGLGAQLAERASERFEWKVEPITFTAPIKEELAFGLRADFEERRLRIVCDSQLVSDLRGIKKAVTQSGNIRFLGESGDSHCDRFWAKALRQQAARYRVQFRAMVG
jgi:phage FluMu gp28-like protein